MLQDVILNIYIYVSVYYQGKETRMKSVKQIIDNVAIQNTQTNEELSSVHSLVLC